MKKEVQIVRTYDPAEIKPQFHFPQGQDQKMTKIAYKTSSMPLVHKIPERHSLGWGYNFGRPRWYNFLPIVPR